MKKLFYIDGGAGRAIASIPAFLKYAKKHDDFAILVHGWDTLYWGIPELQDKVFNPEQKGIFDHVVKHAEEIISPEPYRVPGYFKPGGKLSAKYCDSDFELSVDKYLYIFCCILSPSKLSKN